MTIVQNLLQSDDRHNAKRWYKFGHADGAVRQTDVWEHETFAEEQARWERNDPDYARICEAVRKAKDEGQEASLRADEAKADWDARVATRRQANDDAQKAQHARVHDQSAAGRTKHARAAYKAGRSTFPR